MTSPFLTPAAVVLLLGLGMGAAAAQPGGSQVETPAPQTPVAALSTADRKAQDDAARLCATIKDDKAEAACLEAHAKNREAEKAAAAKRAQTVPAPDPQSATKPAKPQAPARPGG